MFKQLLDPANAVTATGLLLSVLGLHLALAGQPELGVAVVLWALLADHLDGVVAARTSGRTPETGMVGKNLDSLADLVSAGVFPAVAMMVASGGATFGVAAGAILVLASALRLSYFNVFGLDSGRFIGVPTTYAMPVTALVFLVRPCLPAEHFPALLAAALVVVAVLHVTPIRVPRTRGLMYVVVTAYCVIASAILALRHLA